MNETLNATSAGTQQSSPGSLLAVEARRHIPVLIALFAIVIIGFVGSPAFLTTSNLINVLTRVGPLGIVAVGTTILLIAGEIDLSIGSAVSLVSVFVAKAANAEIPTLGLLVLGVAVGMATSLLVGLVVTATRAPAFMVSLGALTIYAGGAAWVSDNQPIVIRRGLDTLGTGQWFGVPVSAYILALMCLVVYVALHHLKFGRLVFAVGGNEYAARLVGIRVDVIRLAVYAANGALVGLAAIILTSRVGFGDPANGVGLELQVIAAVIIGGATLAGGRGSILGSVLGVTLLAAIANVLNLLDVASYLSDVTVGAFIVFAVGLRGPRTMRAGRQIAEAVRERRPARVSG